MPPIAMAIFAQHPASYMDRSWWRDDWLPVPLYERLRRNPRSLARMSRHVVRALALEDVGPVGAGSLEERLLLAPSARLDRLAFLAGVALLSGTISRVLRGADRKLVRAAIGQDGYEFAVRRGRLLLHQARLGDRPDPDLPDFAATATACQQHGIGALASALQHASIGFARRIQLQLPLEHVERFWAPQEPGAEPFRRLLRLLDRELATP